MSYILNALRKSELQRQQTEELSENKAVNFNTAPGHRQKKSLGLLLLLFGNILMLAYIFWSLNQTDDDISKQQAKALPAVIAATEAQPVLATKLPKPATKANQSTATIASIAEQIKRNRAKPINTLQAKAMEIENKTVPPVVKSKKPEIKIVEQKQPPTETIIVKKKTADYPFLAELDYTFQRTVPDLNINVYVYAEQKAQRFIMIDMQKYRAGQEISLGLTLKEIRIDSLLVEYRGRIFLIKRP